MKLSYIKNNAFVFLLLIITGFSALSIFSQKKLIVNIDSNRSLEARLSVDKTYFRKGETIVFNGSGFESFEDVSILVIHAGQDSEQENTIGSWTIFADENGHFESQWLITEDGSYFIKSNGEKSGAQAQSLILKTVTPITVSGNPSCATLNSSTNSAFSHINSNYGFKIDPPASGTFTYTNANGRTLTGGAPADPNNSLTIDIQNSATFDWSSTRPITAVIVKGGPNANVFPFDPVVFGYKDLYTVGKRYAISHIEVCFNPLPASITVIKDSQPNTTRSFSFTATGQVNQNFSLVDNGVVGPDRKQFTNLNSFGSGNTVTITEGASAPYSLTQINCSSNGSGIENNTSSVAARTATIQLEPGENVVCTFVNAVVTASTVSAAGRVFDSNGQSLARVQLILTDYSTSEQRTAITNNFGYYQFDGLEAGGFYTIVARSKSYNFSQNTLAFTLFDAMNDLNFTADSQ